ncbi:MAG: DUF4198 domain-containing protein [Proteobacteria bacterium]|nr:DUF4198 domain-containing protein [Pseudomonadota bacterium]
MRLLAAALLFTTLGLPQARAHDLWLTVAGDGRIVVNYGHPDDRLPPDPARLLELGPVDGASLRPGIARTIVDGIPVLTSALPADARGLLVARYDNGYWVRTPEGSRNTSKRMAPTATTSRWSVKFAKAVVSAGASGFDRPVGHDLEIVPLADPLAVRAGETLPVRVLFGGKPLAGAQVERGDGVTPVPEKEIPRYRTSADGVAEVLIVRPGQQLLVIDHIVPGAHPALATEDMFNATLSFVVRP